MIYQTIDLETLPLEKRNVVTDRFISILDAQRNRARRIDQWKEKQRQANETQT